MAKTKLFPVITDDTLLLYRLEGMSLVVTFPRRISAHRIKRFLERHHQYELVSPPPIHILRQARVINEKKKKVNDLRRELQSLQLRVFKAGTYDGLENTEKLNQLRRHCSKVVNALCQESDELFRARHELGGPF